MELIWSVLSKSSSIDKDSNRLSLLEVIEAIEFRVSPDINLEELNIGIPIEMTITSLWIRSDLDIEEHGHQSVALIYPNGERLDFSENEQEIDLTKTNKRFRTRLNLQGIPYKGSGLYRFIIFHRGETETEWREVATIPFEINRLNSQDTE